ncbi:MAG: TonB-dependent receptor plug domain-containing protein [Leptolyngbyaceae cyanobacterium]
MVKLLWSLSLPTLAGVIVLGMLPAVGSEAPGSASEQPEATSDPGPANGTAADLEIADEPAVVQDLPNLAQAEPVTITNIQLDATETGFTLQLETNGELLAPVTSTTGNATVADIPNAVLQLEGEDFFVSDPIDGIALVRVSALPDNQVRVAITGTAAPPNIDISTGVVGLVVNVALGDPLAQTPDDDALQVVVTGEEEDYFVPNASSATRTDTPLLDIPQAIQVVPQQVLEDQQILRVDDALRNVSGVVGQLNSFSNNAVLILRGFSTNGFNNGPIFRDGFRITDNLSSQEIANVERIEVIKGPSSVLYGQNDPGGIVNLVTKRPLPYPFYELGFQVGSEGLIRPTLDLSGPLTEDGALTYRLNLAYQHEDSFRGYSTDTERFFIAPVLSWDISDRTNLTLLLEYLDEEVPFDLTLPVAGTSVVDVPRDRVQNEPDDFNRSDSLTLGYDFTHAFSDNWTLKS